MFRAVLDTMVLVPPLQRDLLLQLAAEGVYQPLWSSGTVDELDNVIARIDRNRGRADRHAYRAHLRAEMRMAFPGAEIEAPRAKRYTYDVADPADGHVVHAAINGQTNALVTGGSAGALRVIPELDRSPDRDSRPTHLLAQSRSGPSSSR